MGAVNETISNVNAAMRNLLLVVLCGGVGYGGYKAYELYNEPQKQLADKDKQIAEQKDKLDSALKDLSELQKQNTELSAQNEKLGKENERLLVSKKLLEVQHRLARLKVLEQKVVPPLEPNASTTSTESSESRPNVMTKIEFVEINDAGEAIGEPKKFDIRGDMVYVDFLTVSFEDKYIEQSDLDRSTSIALFQRIFGEHQEPFKGFQLDTVGTRPTAYARGTKMSDFEKKIWDDFWLIANDRKQAKEKGIHALQGKAVSMRVQPGKTYEIELRSTGNMTIVPVEETATAGPATKAPESTSPESKSLRSPGSDKH
jgi:hypothetical protein